MSVGSLCCIQGVWETLPEIFTVNVSHKCYVAMKATTDSVYRIRSIKLSTQTEDVSER